MAYVRTETTRRRLKTSQLLVIAFVGFGISSTLAAAEDTPPLVTDRPSASAASQVVPPGYVKIETGYIYGRDEADGVQTTTQAFPGTIVRIGMIPRAELRLGFLGNIWETTEPGQHTSGFGDGVVGTKLYLMERGRHQARNGPDC